MKPLPIILAIALVSSLGIPSISTLAQSDDLQLESATEQDDEPVERVARLSFVQGDVSFLRAGVSEWAAVVENLPLLTGDQLYIGKGARAELQLGRGNYIRLSENTALTIADLTHMTAQFEITEGIAIIRLERFGTAFNRFEIDTPNAALVLQQDGLYRVDVRGKEESEMIIRRGSAEVATLDGSFKVHEGQRLFVDSSAKGRLEVAADNSRDDWDRWSHERDDLIDNVVVAASPDYVVDQETTTNCFYGAGELARYGSWTNVSSYGYCWIPSVGAGWAPYRVGQWLWIPRVGWSWLSHEPWGWAPYHYGRWAYLTSIGWAWVPGIRSHYRYGHSYYQWRPALVRFFYTPTSRGNYIGWCPLNPGERWRRPERHNRRDNDRRDNDRGHGHLRYPTARDGSRRPDSNNRPSRSGSPNGVTVIAASSFTQLDRARTRPEPPDPEITRAVEKGAISGLPDLAPEGAAAPRRRAERNGTLRQVTTPPPEILTRPVVTRNRPSDSQAESFAPRERKLISPRKFKNAISSESPMINKPEGRARDAKLGLPDQTDSNGAEVRRKRFQTGVVKEEQVKPDKPVRVRDEEQSDTSTPKVRARSSSGSTGSAPEGESQKEDRPRPRERSFEKSGSQGEEAQPRADENRRKRERYDGNQQGTDGNHERSRPVREVKEVERQSPRNESKAQERQQQQDRPAAREPERQQHRQQKEERRKSGK